MPRLAIVYHSGYGHTAKVAEHVRKGAADAGAETDLIKADDLTSPDEGPWDVLDRADGIVFGSPTYMGSASGVFGQFKDATSKRWFSDAWKDKIAAGFTNSGSLAGDKTVTLHQLAALAGQHGMVWVNFGMKPGYNSSQSDFSEVRNRAGHFLGLGTQALTDQSPEDAPDAADLATAEAFGRRVAEATARWVRGAGDG